jgi:predicted transcriptional regulator
MTRKASTAIQPPRPTVSELAIMRILWERGPSTVREVLENVNAERPEPLGYTTVLRFLQIMTEKGLVVRDEKDRGHLYEPSVPAERTKNQLVRDMMDRVFGGSAHELVLQALGAGKVSKAELKEIRSLLDEIGGKL